MKTLNGLRGLASFHVVVTHIVHGIQVDLMSAAVLGIFYMMSGFIFTVACCRKPLRVARPQDFPPYSADALYARCTWWLPGMGSASQDATVLGGWTFFKRRLQRLLPVYYYGNFIGAYVNYLGAPHFLMDGTNIKHIILTLLGATSWFPPMLPMGSLVTWSISTMLPFYLVFPAVAPRLQNVDRSKLYPMAVGLYIVQAAWMLYCVARYLTPPRQFWYWFFWSRNPPPMRVPVFLMGCCAGMEHIYRIKNSQQTNNNPQRPSADWEAFKCITPIVLGVLIGMSGTDEECYDDDIGFCFDNGITRILLEALMPILYYDLLLALADPTQTDSVFGKLCNSAPLQFLGDISYSLFVVHFTVYVGIKSMVDFGPQTIAPTIVISLVLSWLLYRVFEAPLASYFSKSNQGPVSKEKSG